MHLLWGTALSSFSAAWKGVAPCDTCVHAEFSFTDAEKCPGTLGGGNIKTACEVAPSRASLAFPHLQLEVKPSSLEAFPHEKVLAYLGGLCWLEEQEGVSAAPGLCRWYQILHRPATFFLDENRGVQVWCGINVTPVSQRCNS